MKKFFDLFVITLLLPVVLPACLVISLLVRTKFGSPIFFVQPRIGLNGATFNMIKFRTMSDACDSEGNLLPDGIRLTNFGKLLRSTSLDELPGFLSVIKGEMSLVGPRPLLIEYLPLYNKDQARRHNVLPGISGWAQVNGRNAITWNERFSLDCWYVENQSFWLDLKILWLTLIKVITRDGINQDGQATSQHFKGNHHGK